MDCVIKLPKEGKEDRKAEERWGKAIQYEGLQICYKPGIVRVQILEEESWEANLLKFLKMKLYRGYN